MELITAEEVKVAFPQATSEIIEEFVDIFNQYHNIFEFNKEEHGDFFLAQLAVEVGPTGVPRRENLNYSCDALKSTFSYYKNNPNEAQQDGRCNDHPANQINIGNKAYGDRLGNDDPDDGYRYRGGGYIQLTGEDNYDRAANIITEKSGKEFQSDDIEEAINTVKGALISAMAFWYDNDLYTCNTIDCVTSKVNKYTDSYDDRAGYYQKIAKI